MCWTAAAVVMMAVSTAVSAYSAKRARDKANPPMPEMPDFPDLMPPAPPGDAPKPPELNDELRDKAKKMTDQERLRMGRKSSILTGLLVEDERPEVKKGGIINYTTKLGG